ncbi:unnamed protein product [Somion occarium]|uniref:Cell division control protein 14 n=1 Tax=Somion occarium TaxID=3059160 RepID=A0ABP1CWK5_9APHY
MLLQDTIQDALDELASTRTSVAQKGDALNTLERLLAELCTRADEESRYSLQYFVALQDTFQCNVPSRLISWISESTIRLDALTAKGSLAFEKESEVATLSSQLMQALSIIQGVVLNHSPSKQWLGRRCALEVLLNLFMASRHVSPMPLNASNSNSPSNSNSKSTDSSSSKNTPLSLSLSSVILDTLLCILVDSSPALRVFEESNGVQYVVKILKRAGTPREVRMKCLEFLYFYLLDETNAPLPPATSTISSPKAASPIAIPTAPNSPANLSTRSTIGSTELSDSPSSSYSSASDITTASNSTYATSFSSSSFNGSSSPVESNSPPKSASVIPGLKPSPRIITPAYPRSMLRKDIDFVPITPKKAQISKLGVGTPRLPSKQREALTPRTNQDDSRTHRRTDSVQTPRKPSSRLSPVNLGLLSPPTSKTSGFQKGHRRAQSSIDTQMPLQPPAFALPRPSGARTMEEKKEILGGMLGNVDALVDGVRKAGIWGLS